MTSIRPLVTLDDITLRIGDNHLFAGTSWSIETGQHWAILGPNGSGKSLLASALIRQVPLAAGQILFSIAEDGQPRSYLKSGEIVRIAPEDHAALIPNSYHQARWNSIEGADCPTVADLLTGESIEFVSAYQVGPTRVPAEVYRSRREQTVDLLGIHRLLDRKTLHLSNGEGRKLLIARGLMQAPGLLILDDPFGGLDAASRQTLRRAIDALLTANRPQLLLLTSRPEEIPPGITHLLCVDGCRIAARGARDEILGNPAVHRLFESADPSSTAPSFPPTPGTASADSLLVDIQRASVAYDGVHVLRDIDWTVRRGERWALLGPNGAGKSTLLSLILADNPQVYHNRVHLFGRRRGTGESIWEVKRRIGWVAPELQRHYPRVTACRNVVCSGFFDSVGLYKACTPRQRELAAQWLASLDITHLANHPFGSVSAGEQRLVLLARALVKNPDLLVLDEPCQGLDASHTKRITGLLDRLCTQTPVSLIYVTHHLEELPNSITHRMQLDQGQMRNHGPRAESPGENRSSDSRSEPRNFTPSFRTIGESTRRTDTDTANPPEET